MNEGQDEERRRRQQRAAAAGAGAVVGAVMGGPLGAIVGAAAGPLLEPFAEKVWEEIRSDGRRRAAEVLASASEAADLPIEELTERIGASERTRLHAGIALSAATRTAWPHKVRTLGRVLASGLLATDETVIDTEEFILAAVADMEASHLTLLELLVCREPRYGPEGPYDVEFARRPYSTEWYAGDRRWTAEQIRHARPRLQPVLTSLIGTLTRHGLIAQNDNLPDALKKFEEAMGFSMSSGASTRIPEPPPSWSPTLLGEQVLGKFREAGIEPDEASG